jgi:hypothetical protein
MIRRCLIRGYLLPAVSVPIGVQRMFTWGGDGHRIIKQFPCSALPTDIHNDYVHASAVVEPSRLDMIVIAENSGRSCFQADKVWERLNEGHHDQWLEANRSNIHEYAALPRTIVTYTREDLPRNIQMHDPSERCSFTRL